MNPPSLMVYVIGDRVGDGLLKFAGIKALRAAFPDHRLIWVTGRRASAFSGPLAPLVRPYLDEIREQTGLGLSLRDLWRSQRGAERHDIVIDTQTRLATSVVLRRIPHRVFISPAAGYRFSDRRPALGTPRATDVRRHFHGLVELAAGNKLPFQPEVEVAPEYHAAAGHLLPTGPRYVGFAPGAGAESKRWPLDRFIALARAQSEAGRSPVFLLGPQEREWRPIIAGAIPQARFPEQDYAGDLGGPLLGIALARRMTAAVANDAGAGHILAASGIPVVTLFGRTNPAKFAGDASNRIIVAAREFGADSVAAIPLDVVRARLELTLAAAP